MKRISVILIFLLSVTLTVSACSIPTPPTEEEAARADELVESVDESTDLDLERSTTPEGATDGIIGEAILEGANVSEELLYTQDLGFDFSEGCTDVYEDATFTIHQQSTVIGPLATVFSEHFFTGVADAVSMVNEYGGPCGVQLSLQSVGADYDPAQMPDLGTLQIDEATPLFLLTYDPLATAAVVDEMQDIDAVAPLDDPVNVVLRMEPAVIYLSHDGGAEATLSMDIHATQATIAHRIFEEAGYAEGATSYMVGYSSILAVVEIIQEILNLTGLDGQGSAAFFAVVSEEVLEN